MTVEDFCKATLPGAARAAVRYGINPIGMMAQSALETGWGKSAPGNMYFGIKAGNSWQGKRQLLWTTEVIDGVSTRVQAYFRAYDTPAESFEDYGRLISGLSRYKTAMQYPGYNEVNMYLASIAAAGYATATNYTSSTVACANKIKQYVSEVALENALAAVKKKV